MSQQPLLVFDRDFMSWDVFYRAFMFAAAKRIPVRSIKGIEDLLLLGELRQATQEGRSESLLTGLCMA